jgi:cold shock CspA family protein
MSGLLARKLFDLPGAEERALEAHERLDLPDTALRLGRIRVWMEKFEEGEALIRESIARADNARTRVIAHTDLLDLGKRRVERLWGEERRPADAVREGVVALREGLDFALGGVVDARLHQILAELLNEIGNATGRVNVAGSVDDEIVALLEKVQAWLPSAEAYGVGAVVKGTLERLGNAPALSEDVKQTVAYLLREPARRAGGSVRAMGYIKRFSQAKGFGFIASADYPDNLFFSRDAVVGGPGEAVTLVPNAPVSFRIGENERGPCAEAVRSELGDDGRPEALKKRTGRITSVEFSYCFAEERETQVDIFIHKSSFADAADWESIGRGEEVTFDVEMSARGLVAVERSVRRLE